MKFLLSLLLSFGVLQSAQAELVVLELAVETNGIRVEYIESSNRGIIYVKGCSECEMKKYFFSKKPIIEKHGKSISFNEFLGSYWNAEYPTLFLDPESLSVLRINY